LVGVVVVVLIVLERVTFEVGLGDVLEVVRVVELASGVVLEETVYAVPVER